MFDRLPTPYGLVRGGVAPDHPKIKNVTKAFDKIAAKPNVHFYGYVEYGKDIGLEDLKKHYHQIVFTTGAQTDRSLNIPGIDLNGSHAATEFVAWYNGHPDYRNYQFDLSQERAAVIGVGNVAADVARILCRTEEELRSTDIADYALEALSKSNVKEVHVLGRRGIAQAKFTNPEIKELSELDGADVFTLPEEMELDGLSQEFLESSQDRTLSKKVNLLQSFAEHKPTGKPRKLVLRFLVSPVELKGDEMGNVVSMRLVKNVLYRTEAGTLRPRHTDQYEELPIGLVFRSIGYRGVPLPGVPFNDDWGVIHNRKGRVIDPETQKPIPGLYTAGWIKRGPTGVIGTNKPDAGETVDCMIEDIVQGFHLKPTEPKVESAKATISRCKPDFFSYQDWLRLNEIEIAKGQEQGRPRIKFTQIGDMLSALGK
jgi:ferredoxin--NADP+ reductase